MLALRKIEDTPGLCLSHIDPPPPPGPGEVTVKVAATGICGTDMAIKTWSGAYRSFMGGALPVTLGHETAGIVIAVGKGVSSPAIGARIVINPAVACEKCDACASGDQVGCTNRQAIGMVRDGAFAETLNAPAAYCYELPETVPLELGALAEPLAIGVHALQTGGMAKGKRVIVFGPGPIGQGAAAMARFMGASEVAVVGLNDAPRLGVLARMGFTNLIDMAEPDAAAKLELVSAGGFDIAIEAAGVDVVSQALSCLAPQGVLVLAGMGNHTASFDMLRLVRMRHQIRGASRIPPSAWPTVLEALAADPTGLAQLVTHRMKLSQAPAGFELCRQRNASKVLLIPDGVDEEEAVLF